MGLQDDGRMVYLSLMVRAFWPALLTVTAYLRA